MISQKDKKILMPVAALAALGFVFFGVKNLFAGKKKVKDDQTVKSAKQEQTALIQQGQKPTFAPSQYEMFADTLQVAMRDTGTDWPKVSGVLNRLNNDLDFVLLFNAFGVRPYYFFGIKQGDWNLTQWFTEEFESWGPFGDNVKDFNAIMKAKGIKYRL